MEIPDATHIEIKALCAKGDALVQARKFTEAHGAYVAAMQLVPEPKEEFNAMTWILAALGDLCFQVKDFKQAAQVFSDAMHCANAIGNPFLHLRLGQAQWELGNHQRAADELCRAYMGAGKDIFAQEDPKYFEFLKSKVLPPAGGAW
jgi:hypothetical protein